MAMNKCIYRKEYLDNDKLGVKCYNPDKLLFLGLENENEEESEGVRITNAMVCSDCTYRKPSK